MKTILKNLIACLFIIQAIAASAQQLNTSQMSSSGQSAEDTKARYILGLVRNNNVEALDKYFSQFPWDIQAKIDVYKNSDKKAAVSIFCVAVDLGLIDVVKTFIKYGYGPADLCDVRTFSKTTQKEITKAEIFLEERNVTDWFPLNSATNSTGGKFLYSNNPNDNVGDVIYLGHKEIKGTYNQVAYKTVTSVKDYFAYPLDFADGEMFNYLFSQGFRSDKLLTQKALKEAQRLGRTDIINYILANMPKKDLAPTVDDATFAKMVENAKANPGSLDYFALVNGTLRYKTSSTQAKNARIELENQLNNMEITQPSDTAGYANMNNILKKAEVNLRKQEAEYQAKADKLRKEDLATYPCSFEGFTKHCDNICPKGTREVSIICYEFFNPHAYGCTLSSKLNEEKMHIVRDGKLHCK